MMPSSQKTIVLLHNTSTNNGRDNENYLNKTAIKTQSSKTNNDSTIQFDIGTKSEIANIGPSGLQVRMVL